MKIIFLGCLLIGINCFAGLPSEDENVSLIIHDFKQSSNLVVSDLNLGKKWQCVFFSSAKGDFTQARVLMSFEESGDNIHAILWRTEQDTQVPYNSDFGMMAFGKKGLVGTFSGRQVYNTFTLLRKRGNQLLVEQSGILLDRYINDEYWGPLFKNAEVAVLDSDKKALYYAKCNQK